jgi:hypothetical protein
MRLEIRGLQEERLVGGDERQVIFIGKPDHPGLAGAIVIARPLQFHIEPVAEDRLQGLKPRDCPWAIAFTKRPLHRPAGSTGQRNQPIGILLQPGQFQMRPLRARPVQIGAADEIDEPRIAALA